MLQRLELVKPEIETGRLVRVLLEHSAATSPMHIQHAPDRRLTPKLRRFIDFAVTTSDLDA